MMAAIDQLVNCYQERRSIFRSIAARMVGPEHAEDAVQDAFVLAVANIQNFREDAAIGTWLTTILRNQCLDMIRRARRRPLCVGIEAYAPILATTEAPPDSFAGANETDRIIRLHRLIPKLPSAANEAIVAYLKCGTVAGDNRLKVNKHRAIKILRKRMTGVAA